MELTVLENGEQQQGHDDQLERTANGDGNVLIDNFHYFAGLCVLSFSSLC